MGLVLHGGYLSSVLAVIDCVDLCGIKNLIEVLRGIKVSSLMNLMQIVPIILLFD